MDERSHHSFKSKIYGAVQEVILPDFPSDDTTTTTTVTKSRRVSFGTNFVKEFIVDAAVSAQCVSEYEQAFLSSDSSNANSSYSLADGVGLDQSTFMDEKPKSVPVPPPPPPPEPEESRPKIPKFASTICFTADSPTADMEFTEGCITLAKTILEKKDKEMTVIIQAKPKEPKEKVKTGKEDETKYFDASQFEMSMTRCLKSKENRREEKRFESEKTKIFSKYDDEMSITRCDKLFTKSKMVTDDESDEENFKENRMPLDLIMRHLDKDTSDLEKHLFNPEKSFNDVFNSNPLDLSAESEKLNLNESMEISRDFQPVLKTRTPDDDKDPGDLTISGDFQKILASDPGVISQEVEMDETDAEIQPPVVVPEEIIPEEEKMDITMETSKDFPGNLDETPEKRQLSLEINPEEGRSAAFNTYELDKEASLGDPDEKIREEEAISRMEETQPALDDTKAASQEEIAEEIEAETSVEEKGNEEIALQEERAEIIEAETAVEEKVNEEIASQEEKMEEVGAETFTVDEKVPEVALEEENFKEIEAEIPSIDEEVVPQEEKTTEIEIAVVEGLEKEINSQEEKTDEVEEEAEPPLVNEIVPEITSEDVQTSMEVNSCQPDVREIPQHPEEPSVEASCNEDDKMEEEREPPLVDMKVIENLKEQSKEPGCLWSLKALTYGKSEGLLSFTCRLLESSTTVTFCLKTPSEDGLDTCSHVSRTEISLDEETQCRVPEYDLVVGFGFEKTKKYLEEAGKKVETIRYISYFLDQVNSFTLKMNSYLHQVYSILTLYPGSRLTGSILTFRLFSFPIFFSSTVSLDLTHLFRLSDSCLSFDTDFGTFNEGKIRQIFRECSKLENPLCDFIVRTTRYLTDIERESGFVSKRNHIRLLPLDLRS